jgi:plasmid replication initiation protein
MANQKRNELSTANWIVKSNTLNEIRHTKMTIPQIRLFSIYLSKINPKDTASRKVEFRLDEYARIMQFKRYNITKLKKTAIDLTGLTIHFETRNDRGGFTITSSVLFRRFEFYKNDDEDWLVSIDCHDDVLPLMFELQGHFFKYKLWNSLHLASTNQQRMYELLKQYENAGAREISVKDLREFLGLKENEYKIWYEFRRSILEASQSALANNTDIMYTWEVTERRGKGGKISKLRFNIEKNENFTKQITFEEFLSEQKAPSVVGAIEEFEQVSEDDNMLFLSEACENEFKLEEIKVLHNLIIKIIPVSETWIKRYEYLKQKYDELNWRAARAKIKNRFGYLKKIIEVDLDEI